MKYLSHFLKNSALQETAPGRPDGLDHVGGAAQPRWPGWPSRTWKATSSWCRCPRSRAWAAVRLLAAAAGPLPGLRAVRRSIFLAQHILDKQVIDTRKKKCTGQRHRGAGGEGPVRGALGGRRPHRPVAADGRLTEGAVPAGAHAAADRLGDIEPLDPDSRARSKNFPKCIRPTSPTSSRSWAWPRAPTCWRAWTTRPRPRPDRDRTRDAKRHRRGDRARGRRRHHRRDGARRRADLISDLPRTQPRRSWPRWSRRRRSRCRSCCSTPRSRPRHHEQRLSGRNHRHDGRPVLTRFRQRNRSRSSLQSPGHRRPGEDGGPAVAARFGGVRSPDPD